MKTPAVSVVMPNFNGAKYIRAAVDSVLAQTYSDFELIVVDDGSTDDSPTILAGYGDRIRFYRQQNAGAAAARNRGIRESRGRLIALLDSDDVWMPEKLSAQIGLFDEPRVGLVYCGCIYADMNLAPMKSYEAAATVTGKSGFDYGPRNSVVGSSSTAVVRREVFEAVGPYDEKLSILADWDMWRRILPRFDVDAVPRPLAFYRVHQAGISASRAAQARNLEREVPITLGNIFSDPHTPEDVRRAAPRIEAEWFLMLSGHFLHARSPLKCLEYALKAVSSDPISFIYLSRYPLRLAARALSRLSSALPGALGAAKPRPQFSLAGRDIVVTSNEPWGEIWYSKHNYAYELSKRNRVVFINPQVRWRMRNLLGCRITSTAHSGSLTILDYNNVLPIINTSLFRLNNLLISSALKSHFKRIGFTNAIMWAFDPNRLYDPGALGLSFSIYHVVDPYEFKHYGETALCRNVDAILCVLTEISADYKGFGKRIHLIPHGISSEEFESDVAGDVPPDMPPGKCGLYLGSIDDRMDFPLLERMLTEFPDTPFWFIGPLELEGCGAAAHDIFIAKKHANLRHLPGVGFKRLKNFIARSKFCLAINTVKVRRLGYFSSHKVLQYLALGKPVFQSALGRSEFAGLVYMSDDADELMRQFRGFQSTGESDDSASKRVRFAEGFTFEEIFKRVEKCIIEENNPC